jgi:hypothetical protein
LQRDYGHRERRRRKKEKPMWWIEERRCEPPLPHRLRTASAHGEIRKWLRLLYIHPSGTAFLRKEIERRIFLFIYFFFCLYG